MNSPAKSKNFFPSDKLGLGEARFGKRVSPIKIPPISRSGAEPLLAKSFNIGSPPSWRFLESKGQDDQPVHVGGLFMTARKLSPKAAPHLFPPLLPQEGERDIIGILGVRLPRRPPSLSFHFLQGSRVIDTLSTVSRLRCRGWPTYRLDSRPTINHRLRGWKRRPRGHGSVNLHSRTTLFPRLIMNPIIERRNNAFRYRIDSFAPSIFSIFVAIFFIII